jgi:hypothetical protein
MNAVFRHERLDRRVDRSFDAVLRGIRCVAHGSGQRKNYGRREAEGFEFHLSRFLECLSADALHNQSERLEAELSGFCQTLTIEDKLREGKEKLVGRQRPQTVAISRFLDATPLATK